MTKLEIISLSGEPASGKGAVSNLLSEKLNYGIYRNGEYFRKLAKDKNMSVTEFNIYVESHPEIDKQIEQSASIYAENHTKFIIDARLGFYAVPNSFKVYLTVDIDEAAKRAFNDQNRKDTEIFKTEEEQKKDLLTRKNLETERYKNLYNVDKTDLNNYNLVIDTTNKTPNEVVDLIINEYNNWLKK